MISAKGLLSVVLSPILPARRERQLLQTAREGDESALSEVEPLTLDEA